jgi:hypothetical protein
VSRTTRLTLAAAAALLALALTASAAIAAPPGALTADPPGPFTLTAGASQTVTFKNPGTKGSTSALTATLTGAGFTKTDGCTGTALGPRKSCSITVTAPSSVPIAGATATLTVTPKNRHLAPVTVSFTAVQPATLSLSLQPADCGGSACVDVLLNGSGLVPGSEPSITATYNTAGFTQEPLDFGAVETDGTIVASVPGVPCQIIRLINQIPVVLNLILVDGTADSPGGPIQASANPIGLCS